MLKKLSTGYKITSPGLITALTCFFMPWVLESCGNQPMQPYTGWQIAIGPIGTAEGGYGGNPFVLLSFVALLVLVIFVIRSARRASLTRRDTYGVLVTSVVVLLILYWLFLTTPPEWLNREILPGLWGYIVGWLLILIGGVVNTVERHSSKKQGQ